MVDFTVRPWTFKTYRKPLFYQAEFDPFGRLSNGLVSAILFESSGFIADHVRPGQKFTPVYPFPNATPGVGSFSNGGFGTWTVSSGGVALLNGSPAAFSTGVTMLVWLSPVVAQFNTAGIIYYWSGSNWLVYPAADPRIGHGLLDFEDSIAGGTINGSQGGYLNLSLPIQTPGNWTASARILFTGATQSYTSIYFADGSGNYNFFIQGANGSVPNALSFNGTSSQCGSWLASSYTGWHRVTCVGGQATSTGTFYFDGVAQGSQTINVGIPQFASLLGDAVSQPANTSPFQVADMFLWNRALDASDVLAHAKNPYSSALRPRFPRRDQVSNVNAKLHPSLTLTGVGP